MIFQILLIIVTNLLWCTNVAIGQSQTATTMEQSTSDICANISKKFSPRDSAAEIPLGVKSWGQLVGAEPDIFPKQLNCYLAGVKSPSDFVPLLKMAMDDPQYGTPLVYRTYRNEYKKGGKKCRRSMVRFRQSLFTICGHNVRYLQGQTSYQQGVNKFTDLSHKRFVALYTGALVNGPSASNSLTIPQKYGIPETTTSPSKFVDPTKEPSVTAPSNLDYRTMPGVVTRVKNQGDDCASCTTFATVAVTESAFALSKIDKGIKNEAPDVTLSEQEILDCTSVTCKVGGFLEETLNYAKFSGLPLESEYNYTGQKSITCMNTSHHVVAKLKHFQKITPNDEEALKFFLWTKGPIAVVIDVPSDNFSRYHGDVYKENCDPPTNGQRHAIAIVGYGTGNTPDLDYWILKNSWGDWGEKGYIKLQRGTNLCNVTQEAYYVEI